MKNKNIILFGYSGHAYSVINGILSNEDIVIGYYDAKENQNNPYNITYLGHENDISQLKKIQQNDFVFPAIGNNAVRHNLLNFFSQYKLQEVSIIHPKSIISNFVTIEKSVFVSMGAIINEFSTIKHGSIINSGAIIEHECEIGICSHIAPGAVLCGNVKIGDCSFIGANTVIKQGVTIGNHVTIGAGSVVLHDIEDHKIYMGNPAREK